MSFLRGHFLVASPHLPDGNFFRSVVLMVEHNEEGAFGLVLNRPMSQTLGEINELEREDPLAAAAPVFLGGPVPGPLIALHADSDIGETEVLPDLFVTSEKEHLQYLASQHEHACRMFSGYSGWAPGQLEGELKLGGWLTTPATREEVFSDPNTVWERVTRRINLEILSAIVDPDEGPAEAWFN